MLAFAQSTDYSDEDDDHSSDQPSGKQQHQQKRQSSGGRSGPWLTIDAACKMIGVDQSTLRRWSDSGKIPVFRTPGGHRRYSEDDLKAFMAGEQRPRRRMSRQLLTNMSLAGYEQDYLKEAADQPWYNAYDEESIAELRKLGRRMVDLTMRYISGRGDRDEIIEQSRMVARKYGYYSARAGLSTTDALEAFLFFRRPVIHAVNRYFEEENITSRRSARTINDLINYMDDLLITTITVHEDHQRSE